MNCRPHPILCIVPPHMLREAAQRGSERQRQLAWQTLTMSEHVRGQRQALNVIAALAVTPAGQKHVNQQQQRMQPIKVLGVLRGATQQKQSSQSEPDACRAEHQV